MGDYAILENGKVRETTIEEWGAWNRKEGVIEKIVGRNFVETKEPGVFVTVSTVFLGIDHSFGYGNQQLWFETLVFGGELSDEMERYETFQQAIEGHKEMWKRVEKAEIKAARKDIKEGE